MRWARKMRVAFHLYNFSLRGSEIATFDYAKGNKDVLNNESVIICPLDIREKRDYLGNLTYNDRVEQMFTEEFGKIYLYASQSDLAKLLAHLECDVFYILKSGENDGIGEGLSVKTVVHCVFVCQREMSHGSIYASISRPVVGKYYSGYVDKEFESPIVPHVCAGGWSDSGTVTRNFRAELMIPNDATVFGRYGGYETFDISFAQSAVLEVVDESPNNYFVFMNTPKFATHPRILFMNASTDRNIKCSFVSMCDAMLHARTAGESFGLSVAEFALKGKPIITYKPESPHPHEHDAHRLELGDAGIYYKDKEELLSILRGFKKHTVAWTGYSNYTIDKVMTKFGNVFLGMEDSHEGPWTVRLLCNWTSSDDLVKTWSKLGKSDNIILVGDENAETDYTVIVNAPPAGVSFNPKRTIVFRMEPDEDVSERWNNWYDNKSDFLLFANHMNFQNNCEWHLSAHSEHPIEKDSELEHTLSAVISDQMSHEGHIMRVQLCQYLQSKGDVNLHVYGRGNPGFRDHRGELPYHAKDMGVLPYKYGFNAENISRENYVTEKLWDLIMGECLAFYWGCPNVDEIIDPRAYVRIDISKPEDACKVIKSVIESDAWSRHIHYIREAKKRIIKYYAFVPRLENLIRTSHLRIAVITSDSGKLRDVFECSRIRAISLRTYDEASKACMESDTDWLVLSGDQMFSPRLVDRISQFYAELRDASPEWGAGVTWCYGNGLCTSRGGDGWACTAIGAGCDSPIMSYILSPRGACIEGYPVISSDDVPIFYSNGNIL